MFPRFAYSYSNRRRFLLLTWLFVGMTFLVMGWTPVAAGQEEIVDGVTYIRNGATPDEGVVTLTATEQWRAGGDDDEVFFGNIQQVLADVKGNIYLMDSQISEVAVYSPDGEHLRTLSREGDGPGEIRHPNDMFFHPDGSLGLVQMFPGKIVKVNRDGSPSGALNFGSGDPSQGRFVVLLQGISRAGNLVLAGIRMTFNTDGTNGQTYFLSRCDEMAVEQHCYFSKENTINYSDFVLTEEGLDFVWGRCALGLDGKLYVVPFRNEYEIDIYSVEGTLERMITREYESLTRDDEQREVARQILEAVARNYPAPPRDLGIEDTEPDIAQIRVSSSGEIWVRTSRGDEELPENAMAVLDVFDSAGHFKKQVALGCPGNAREDALYFVGDDRVVMVAGALDAFLSQQGVSSEDEETDEEETPMEVICYSLESE